MKKPRDEKNEQHNPGRRRFLKGVGIAGAGAAVVDKLWVEGQATETQKSAPQSGW
jgi:hypothetical protein